MNPERAFDDDGTELCTAEEERVSRAHRLEINILRATIKDLDDIVWRNTFESPAAALEAINRAWLTTGQEPL